MLTLVPAVLNKRTR